MATKNSSSSAWNAYKKNEAQEPGEFTYNAKKPTFNYDDSDLQSYYDKLMNRKDFSFNLDENALYNQYKDAYTKQGQLAMMDTIGQASAMTGGYGNSYAASAGQQAYQQNLENLNEVVPDIYQLALEQYQMEGENLLDMYGVASNERDVAYGQYRDDVSDYYTDKDFAYSQYRDNVSDWQADREFLYDVYSDARDYEYQLDRDKVTDAQWQAEYDLAVEQFAEDIRQFDLNYALSEKEFEEMCRQFALEYDLDYKKFEEDVRQYNASLAEEQRQYNASLAEEQRQYNASLAHDQAVLAEEQRQYNASLAEEQRQYNASQSNSSSGSSGSSSSSGSGSSSSKTTYSSVEYQNKIQEVAQGAIKRGILNDKAALQTYLNNLVTKKEITSAQKTEIYQLLYEFIAEEY